MNKVYKLVSKFWINQNEMKKDIEDLGLYVAEINNEYVTVAEEDDDMSAILYLGRANETMWIERIVFVDENGFEIEDDNEEEEEW